MDHNVPFGQLRVALQSVFYHLHRPLAQRYTLVIDLLAQLDDGA